MCWRVGESWFRFVDHPVERQLERRVIQAAAEFQQFMLCCLAECVPGWLGLRAVEGNLHLYSDSANLASPVLHKGYQFGGKLAQFCGAGGVGDSDAEPAQFQAQNLDGLRKVGRRDRAKVGLQV